MCCSSRIVKINVSQNIYIATCVILGEVRDESLVQLLLHSKGILKSIWPTGAKAQKTSCRQPKANSSPSIFPTMSPKLVSLLSYWLFFALWLAVT